MRTNDREPERILSLSELPVFVVRFESGCVECRAYRRDVGTASREHPGAVYVEVDLTENPGVGARLGAARIPCTIVFRNGVEAGRPTQEVMP